MVLQDMQMINKVTSLALRTVQCNAQIHTLSFILYAYLHIQIQYVKYTDGPHDTTL
jgi:hypothetical protein